MPDTPPSDAGSTQGRKARTKTFSGCWTCRAKHVKCDETRPVCNRCRRSGLACEGYGVRLSWTSVRGPSNFRTRTSSGRRADRMQVDKPFQFQEPNAPEQPAAQPAASTAEDRHHLRESTVASEGSTQADTSNSGLGSAPDLDSPGRDGNSRLSHAYKMLGQGLSGTASDAPYAPLQQQMQQQQRQQQQQQQQQRRQQQQQQQHQHQQQQQQQQQHPQGQSANEKSPDSAGTQNQNKTLNESYQDITWLPQCATPPSTFHLNYRNQQVNIPNPGTHIRHLDVLPNPGIQCQLLEHWTLHLCDALNPVPGVHNPLRTIMMPIALEGARADVNSSTGATALFHLICSASAFSLAQRGTTPESQRELESAALEHHNLGITHLGQNIQSDDRSQCVPLLASLVMCIYNEVITVPTPFWRLHFRGAVEWVNHISPQVWHQTEAASVIYQMFIGMATLVQSQLFLVGHEDHMWEIPFDQLSQPGRYSLDVAFGMPQHVMQCLQSMNKSLMEAKRSGSESVASPSTSQDFDRLEVELYLSAPTRPSSSLGKEHGDLIYHHGYTFYFAALIFMKRTVKDTPIEDVQALIAQSLSHVEALDTSTDRPFCPMLWPIAILAFEACDTTLQNRMLKCLETFANRSGFAIWTQLENLVRDLWEMRKAEGNPNLKWHKSVLTSINDSFMLL